jgi:hypothetical protein
MVSSGVQLDDSDGWELKQTVEVVVGHLRANSQPAPHPFVSRVLPSIQLKQPYELSPQSPTEHMPFL